jgi:hypothetical protein
VWAFEEDATLARLAIEHGFHHWRCMENRMLGRSSRRRARTPRRSPRRPLQGHKPHGVPSHLTHYVEPLEGDPQH